ncbi:unnamed protein product [Mycena citricolor]|uniref:DH domain-containing protein n=1 Tax=Mycena citricolor TaxID=2018698 RepID=A0AAD2HTI5_9AGAR|nr:unnamed protein product [Mycena citricolor]
MEPPPPAPPPRSPLRPPPTSPPSEQTVSKRQHALTELIASERAYVSDLALVLEVHVPLAEGPMSLDDIRIIFGNIEELAELSDALVEAMERTMGTALENADATDDKIGELFLRYAPEVEAPYKQYITRHPSALAHLNSLPQTPELTAYHQKCRDTASTLSHAWDLASLLIKPVQRLLKYSLLLAAIIDATAPTHPDRPNLVAARAAMEEVAHAVNEGKRRAEVVKEVLTSPKKPPTMLRIKSFRAPADVNSEAARVDRMAAELARIDVFAQQFSRCAQEWARMADTAAHTLLAWAKAFGAAIGLSATVRSEAFDAFLSTLTANILPASAALLAQVASDLLAPLARLLATAAQPRQLIASMVEHAPLHHHLLTMPVSAKNRPPPALLTASAHYLALRGQLFAELPTYLALLHRGLAALVRRLAAVQAGFFGVTRDTWAGLWDMLRVEGERNGGGSETEAVWRARWGDVDAGLLSLGICHPLRISQQLSLSSPVVEAISISSGEWQNTVPGSPTSPQHYERASSSSASVHSSHSGQATQVNNMLAALEGPRRSGQPAPVNAAATTAMLSALHPSPPQVSGPFPLSPSRPHALSDTGTGWSGFPGWNSTSRGKSPGRSATTNGKKTVRGKSPTPTQKSMRDGGLELGVTIAEMGWDYSGALLPPKKIKDPEREEEKMREKERARLRKLEQEEEKARKKEEKKKEKDKGLKNSKSADRGSLASSKLALLENGGYGSVEKKSSRSSNGKKADEREQRGVARRTSDITNNMSPGTKRSVSRGRPISDEPSSHMRARAPQLPRQTSPGPENEQLRARRSTWLAAPIQYSCRVIQPCKPPETESYFGYPFFTLEEHAIFGVLHEAGHPSTHPRLPLYVDDGEDCLLLCRNASDDIGWVLASFLAPLAAD